MEEAASHEGGASGRGGDILWRWGNPHMYLAGTRLDQKLFCQHSSLFVPADCPGDDHILVFNNGRNPDRLWSDVLEIELPDGDDGSFLRDSSGAFLPADACWRYGPRVGRAGSFYCTHISGCQRLPNGNTLITQGTW